MFMRPQHERCSVVCIVSRQADEGISVQKTVIASRNSALFFVIVIVSKFQVFTLSIRCWAIYGGDLDHIGVVPKNKRSHLKISKTTNSQYHRLSPNLRSWLHQRIALASPEELKCRSK